MSFFQFLIILTYGLINLVVVFTLILCLADFRSFSNFKEKVDSWPQKILLLFIIGPIGFIFGIWCLGLMKMITKLVGMFHSEEN